MDGSSESRMKCENNSILGFVYLFLRRLHWLVAMFRFDRMVDTKSRRIVVQPFRNRAQGQPQCRLIPLPPQSKVYMSTYRKPHASGLGLRPLYKPCRNSNSTPLYKEPHSIRGHVHSVFRYQSDKKSGLAHRLRCRIASLLKNSYMRAVPRLFMLYYEPGFLYCVNLCAVAQLVTRLFEDFFLHTCTGNEPRLLRCSGLGGATKLYSTDNLFQERILNNLCQHSSRLRYARPGNTEWLDMGEQRASHWITTVSLSTREAVCHTSPRAI